MQQPQGSAEKIRVMIVDDEPDIRVVLSELLQAQGFEVVVLSSAIGILEQIALHKPSVLLIDHMMPEVSGVEAIVAIRSSREFGAMPVIFVTGLSGELEKVQALDLGADDYVTKPFLPKELTARINALVRRTAARALSAVNDSDQLVRGSIRVELRSHRAFVADEEIQLTLTEFKILRELLRQVDHVLTREQLRERALESTNVTDRTIDVHMASLRKKMGPIGDSIETVRGVGYRLAR